MRNQIQQSQVHSLIRIAGRGLLAAPFALSVVLNAGAVQNPLPAQQSKNQQTQPFNKTKRLARTVSEQEILEARELLDQLGYWVNVDVTGNDVSLRHALIAFQKTEGRGRTGVLTIEELELCETRKDHRYWKRAIRT